MHPVLLFCVSVVAGFVGAMSGMGGGVVLVPALTLLALALAPGTSSARARNVFGGMIPAADGYGTRDRDLVDVEASRISQGLQGDVAANGSFHRAIAPPRRRSLALSSCRGALEGGKRHE